MNTNTNNDTNLKTQDNTPVNSDDEQSDFIEMYFARNAYKETKLRDLKDEDMIYHINPERIIAKNPDLAGKVEQAYIYCKSCNSWQNLTTENSIQLRFGEFRFQKQCYVGNYLCWTPQCNQAENKK